MTRLCAFTAASLLCSFAGGAAAQPRTNADAALLADFTKRVAAYAAIRKAASEARQENDDKARPLEKTSDPAKIRMAQQGLAAGIRAARAGARHGDIFTPEISAHFRRLLRPEVKEPGTKAAIKDDNPGAVPFKVNGPYPDKEPLATVPPNVLASLPPLPKDIDYRFVGKHLVLRDSRANIIIDYITDAIP